MFASISAINFGFLRTSGLSLAAPSDPASSNNFPVTLPPVKLLAKASA